MSGQGPLAYLSVSGVETANAARTLAYMRQGLADTMQGHWVIGVGDLCGVLYRLNGGDCVTPDVFVSPQADPAPWYDANEPGSATFLGVVLLDMDGFDSTLTRVVTNRIQGLGGASFSGQRRNPRTWKFQAALVSADDAGAEYGLRWLTSALKTSECDSCATGDLTVFLACPPEDCADETLGMWTSYDVVLDSGPFETEKWAPKPASLQGVLGGCRDFVVVEWTMTAGNPFLYKPAEVCLEAEILGVETKCSDICDFLFGDPGEPHCCHVNPPAIGTVAPIFTFDSQEGMNSILLQAFSQCPSTTEGTPELQMEISGVPTLGTVIVDCARRKITIIEPDPDTGDLVVSDGQHLLVIGDTGIQWLESRDCDDIYCFCARTAHPCSQGGDTTVQIETQYREG